MAGFGGVRQGVADEVGNVLIGQPIFNVLTAAAAGDEALGTEDPETLGDGGEFFAFGEGDFGDASGTAGEEGEEAEAGGFAEGAEDACGAVDGLGGDGLDGRLVGVVFGSAGGRKRKGHRDHPEHLNNCSTVRVIPKRGDVKRGGWGVSL